MSPNLAVQVEEHFRELDVFILSECFKMMSVNEPNEEFEELNLGRE